MVENVNALALLKEEMQTEEIHLKVNAIHRLKTVILSIGINETNTQLIPYLDCKCHSAPIYLAVANLLISAHLALPVSSLQL